MTDQPESGAGALLGGGEPTPSSGGSPANGEPLNSDRGDTEKGTLVPIADSFAVRPTDALGGPQKVPYTYNPEEQQDSVRLILVAGLLIILGGLVVGAFWGLSNENAETQKNLIQVIGQFRRANNNSDRGRYRVLLRQGSRQGRPTQWRNPTCTASATLPSNRATQIALLVRRPYARRRGSARSAAALPCSRSVDRSGERNTNS